jgi:hypothetical protein
MINMVVSVALEESSKLQFLKNNPAPTATSIIGGKEIYNAEMTFVSQHGGCPSTQGGTLPNKEGT